MFILEILHGRVCLSVCRRRDLIAISVSVLTPVGTMGACLYNTAGKDYENKNYKVRKYNGYRPWWDRRVYQLRERGVVFGHSSRSYKFVVPEGHVKRILYIDTNQFDTKAYQIKLFYFHLYEHTLFCTSKCIVSIVTIHCILYNTLW